MLSEKYLAENIMYVLFSFYPISEAFHGTLQK